MFRSDPDVFECALSDSTARRMISVQDFGGLGGIVSNFDVEEKTPERRVTLMRVD